MWRQIALAGAGLVVLLLAGWALPLEARERPRPFPAALRVVPTALRPAAGDEEARLREVFAAVDRTWARTFARAGLEYETPELALARAGDDEVCDTPVSEFAGLYCPDDRRVVIALRDDAVERALDPGLGDDLLAYTLAHELGHHVQELRDGPAFADREQTVRLELQADCLAGVWGHAARRPLPPAAFYVADEEHGPAAEQRRWLERGHRSGRPATCDGVWVASGAA